MHGITVEDYDKLLKDQNDCCAICNKHKSQLKRVLFVDHCHKTSRVRGLLCQKCNSVLGLVNDSIEILDKAKEYLNTFITSLEQVS